ncbi:6927_t:CDS:10 [Ambispora leptoticha]|uniref:aminodeoxychorismate synthase n=1 Tax=Ambispora leptoticha TaxID=144679 RepID=A0A9N8Z8E4_9GLOM|nr:6927_t:CDS:10 [Ambispora leptoticha]
MKDCQHTLRTLIIDNYDSYTFNLLHLWNKSSADNNSKATQKCFGATTNNVIIIRNDQFEWDYFKTNILPYFDNVIISPGPGSPEKACDCNVPVLGVCLGHQGIGTAFGAKDSLFFGIPDAFYGVRYHSLVVDHQNLPSDLMITAWFSSNEEENNRFSSSELNNGAAYIIMGLQHKYKPYYGVQFHPESICTEYGHQLAKNFQKITYSFLKKRGRFFQHHELPSHIQDISIIPTFISRPREISSSSCTSPKYHIVLKRLNENIWIDSEKVFENIVSVDPSLLGTWWLDSARRPDPQSRFSFMGSTPSEANAFSVSYATLPKRLQITCSNGIVMSKVLTGGKTFWDWMSDTMNLFNKCVTRTCVIIDGHQHDDLISQQVPFDFRLGMMGYFGYEMKRESLSGYVIPQEQWKKNICNQVDAAFIFATQAIVFDHLEKRIWLAGLIREKEHSVNNVEDIKDVLDITTGFSPRDFTSWIKATENRLLCLIKGQFGGSVLKLNFNNHRCKDNNGQSSNYIENKSDKKRINKHSLESQIPSSSSLFIPDIDYPSYISAIEQARSFIHDGQSYEICLTTQIRTTLNQRLDDSLELYKHLRRKNPAPFSALFDFAAEDSIILSSSPEKFIEISSDGCVEMKPIKGTVAVASGCFCVDKCDKGKQCELNRKKEDRKRAQSLECNVKERAENLMIVDLIRHDLVHICLPETVRVPLLMKVETYETMHQLVTTVHGSLKSDIDCVEAVRKCFPPGSMTGAPKLRSVQLLDELENHIPRGVYSGCLGYLSIGDGTKARQKGSAMFSVVIRTAVVGNGTDLSIGAGGAITFLSNADEEWREAMLKAQSVIPSVLAFTNETQETATTKKKKTTTIKF